MKIVALTDGLFQGFTFRLDYILTIAFGLAALFFTLFIIKEYKPKTAYKLLLTIGLCVALFIVLYVTNTILYDKSSLDLFR